LKDKVKDTQKDKNGDIILLYANHAQEQHSFIDNARTRGYEVIILDSPLASHFISQIEMKNQDVKFKRVDADVIDKLIENTDALPITLSDEQQTSVKDLVSSLVDSKKYVVKIESLSASEAPFVVTQNEFMRRMKEQSAMGGGGGFYGQLPESYDLIANGNHPLMEKILSGNDEGKAAAKQAIDLALLAKGLLKGEDLTTFIKRSFDQIS
jgi:molecular chaperone HtpG